MTSHSIRIRIKRRCISLSPKGANNYTFDEIQVALANTPDGDPLTWLNENWVKLIETVQTLATKYGQEHKENIVGTISSVEAREVLIKNKGSVWHAVTACIEQRQQAFNAIKSQGNYSREDIVSSLTAHNGNTEMALAELNRLQMRPFLKKIQGSPPTTSASEQPMTNGHQAENNESHPIEVEATEASKENDAQTNEEKRDILRDIEAIIGSMEEKQSKQTENLLNTIENLVGNMLMTRTGQSISSASSFSNLDQSDRLDRIDVKSPIQIPKVTNEFDQNADVQTDVKNFVSRHIQDVVPDVAALINKELVQTSEPEFSEQTVERKEEAELEQPVDIIENIISIEGNETPPESIETTTAIGTEQSVANEVNIELAKERDNSATEESTSAVENIAPNDISANPPQSVDEKIVPIQNGEMTLQEVASTSSSSQVEKQAINIETLPTDFTYQSFRNKPRYVVTKSTARFSQKQMDKKRIRELEKQLRRQQRKNSMKTDRYDSQSNGYLSDSTVIAEEMPEMEQFDVLPGVSNEKTFSLSIVEQAVHVDDNKEHNHTIESPIPPTVDPMQPSTSGAGQQIDDKNPAQLKSDENASSIVESMKDIKNRNLSKLVEDTKSLIQLMKHEIDEDIAMSASEFGDNDEYLSDDEIIYSDEMGEGESEFSDSWEDISDDESVISEESEYYNEENVEFQRSSQSVESEFYAEAQETLTGENGHVEENVEILEKVSPQSVEESSPLSVAVESSPPSVGEGSSSANVVERNSSVINEINTENDEESVQIVENQEIISNEQQIMVDTNNNVEIQENFTENPDQVETPLSPATMNLSVPSVDDNLMEHMLEIQQSLHTSSIISVNFRETDLREKSESVEPSSDSQVSSPIQSPDQPSVYSPDPEEHTAEEEAIVLQTIETNTVNDYSSVSQSNNVEEVIAEQSNIHADENPPNTNVNSDKTATEIVPQVENTPVLNGEHEVSETESQSQSHSISISENQISHANDTESELEELSVDVSTSDSTNSKDNASIHSSMSTVSVGSEKLVESYKYKKITVPVLTQCSSTKINVMQLKKSTPEKATFKNKIPVRRPSLTEPSASIRNIQNELLNKQLKQPPKMVSKKPSKIVPPKLFFKSNSDISANTTPTGPSKTSKVDASKPSTSNEKRSIPKKKYYETCFSDDNYQTSDDEKPITSKKVIPNLVKIIESNTEEDAEVRLHFQSQSNRKVDFFNFVLIV